MKTIAIIGATGNMGSAIAKSLSKSTNRILLFDNKQDKAQLLVNDILSINPGSNVTAINCPIDASWEADIIILAVPFAAEKEVAAKIKEVANQKIVISISNPLNETFDGLVTAPDTSAGQILQELLPNSKVVKAFNTTFAADFSNTIIDGKQVDCFIAGNDDEATETVAELVKIVGFNPIIAGDLATSSTLEQMQLLLIKLGIKYNHNWLAGWKILHQ